MPALEEIPGISAASLELLEAAGLRDADDLAKQNAGTLAAELKKANDSLSIAKRAPGTTAVEKWIAAAIDLVSSEQTDIDNLSEPAAREAVNYEANAEVSGMLDSAPYAIPLPGKNMMEKNLRVSDIPAGILLNRYSGNLDVKVEDSEKAPRVEVPLPRGSGNNERVETKVPKREFDPANVKYAAPSPNGAKRIPKSKSGHEEDRVALIRAPREKTNRGKDPSSRRYIRGVLHTHPWTLKIGAIFSLLLLLNLPLAIISAFLLLLLGEQPEAFAWVPKWILAFPIALPIIGIGYLIFGFSGKCRICTQKLFVHKGALKHVKAHRLPLMGYVVPLCLHLLLFNWFRCSSCGTPVRLKK